MKRRRPAPLPSGPITERPAGIGLKLLFTLWVFILFDPQWFVAYVGPNVFLKLPTLLFAGLLLTLIVGVPAIPAWSRRWTWYPPFMLYILAGVVTLPWAMNNGMAREALQVSILFWAVVVGTSAIVDSARRAEILLRLYGLQFVWWGAWGATAGLIRWHPQLANYDGYGAFAVGGIGISYFAAMASQPGWFKRIMYVSAGICALAVVASFARGAFLAAMTLFAVIWIRSPRKGATAAAGVGAILIIVIAAVVLFPPGWFMNEIMSAFSEGTTEGTGEDRWELWMAAVKVFEHRPIFGVGPRNFGVFAAMNLEAHEVGGMYAQNVLMLYGRSLHSFYFTVLSELGIVGCFALAWIVVDFWKRNAVLRRPDSAATWKALGGTLELRQIALGLEACMIAFLVTAALYALEAMHWFYTMLALNMLLHTIVTRRGAMSPAARRRARVARGGMTAEPLVLGLTGPGGHASPETLPPAQESDHGGPIR